MRLIHTSDWHLGHEFYGSDRGVEHDVFLDWLARKLVELKADALVVSGDIYDAVNPPVPAQKRLYQFLRRVLAEDAHLEIVIVGGNHDSAARLELPRELLHDGRVQIFGAVPRSGGRAVPEQLVVELHDRTGSARVVCGAVPYLRAADLPAVNTGESAAGALYRQVLDRIPAAARALPRILTGHLHITGATVSELSERRVIVGGQEAITAAIFPASVAYVALGHLHKPQDVDGSTRIRYSGSPFPMSMAEKDYEHSVTVVDVEDRGAVRTSVVRTPRPVPFIRVPAVGHAALSEVENELRRLDLADPGLDRRAFLEVAVRLNSGQPDLKERIEAAIEGKPVRLTRIVKDASGSGGSLGDRMRESATLDELEPISVFVQRHREEHGTDPTDALTNAFREVLAGVHDHVSPHELQA